MKLHQAARALKFSPLVGSQRSRGLMQFVLADMGMSGPAFPKLVNNLPQFHFTRKRAGAVDKPVERIRKTHWDYNHGIRVRS